MDWFKKKLKQFIKAVLPDESFNMSFVGLFIVAVLGCIAVYIEHCTEVNLPLSFGLIEFMMFSLAIIMFLYMVENSRYNKERKKERAEDREQRQLERAEDKAMFETLCTILLTGERPKELPGIKSIEIACPETDQIDTADKKASLLIITFKDSVSYQDKIKQVENLTILDYEAIIREFDEKEG